MLVIRLQLARLGTSVRLEVGVKSELQARHQLLVVNSCVQAVVSCPFLSEGETMLLDLVLGLQGTSLLAPVSGGVAASGELNPAAGFALHLQLHQAKVVAFSKDIPCLFSNVRVRWGCHASFKKCIQAV